MANHRELRCARCGYNLRGLNTSVACPECGHAVSLTLAQQGRRPRLRIGWSVGLFIALALLHLVIAGLLIAAVLSTGRGDGGIMLLVLDLPFWIIWDFIVGARQPVGSMTDAEFLKQLFVSSVGGTIMYGLVGAFFGFLIDYVRFRLRLVAAS